MPFDLTSGTVIEIEPPPIPQLLVTPPSGAVVDVLVPAPPNVLITPPPVPTLTMNPPPAGTVPVLVVQGPPGPQGPPGTSGPGGSSFVYTQDTPAATWIINHGLGRLLHVTILDSSLDIAYADVIQGTLNQATIIFATPTMGSVVLS